MTAHVGLRSSLLVGVLLGLYFECCATSSLEPSKLVECVPNNGSCTHCTHIQQLKGYYCQGIMSCSGCSALDRFCGCENANCTASPTVCHATAPVNGTCVAAYQGTHSPEHCSSSHACSPQCSDPEGCSDNPTDPACQYDCGCGRHDCQCSDQCLAPAN